MQHSILLNVSLAGITLFQTLFSFKHFITMVKLLKPASSVMLFPPTNPFLFFLHKPYLALSTWVSQNRTSRACSFCFWGAGCQNYTARLKGSLLLHYAYQVHTLYFHFHLHLQSAVGTLVTPHHRSLVQANISSTSKKRNWAKGGQEWCPFTINVCSQY